MVALRLLRTRQRRLRTRAAATWLPVVRDWVLGGTANLPRLSPVARPVLLNQWLHAHDAFQGDVTARLNELARAVGLDDFIAQLLRRPVGDERLQAVIACGYLGASAHWDRLAAELDGDDALLALAAARAMIRIDAERGLPAVLDQVERRTVWHERRTRTIFDGPERGALTEQLATRLGRAGPLAFQRLLGLVEVADGAELSPIIAARISSFDDPELVADCLRMLRGPAHGEQVRAFLDHPVWFVRVRALASMEATLVPADRSRLQELVRDPAWWVAHRAQELLAQLDGEGGRP